ncbi:hypothetical protein CAP31_08190 [Sulfuriferula sp. AH1]|nr:hypothetical protein CAP31_08190 [Sulfuriferula sp. AH1]
MKFIQRVILSSLVLLCLNQSAWAVRPAHEINQPGILPPAKAKNIIQRGGKITAINTSQHTISVDEVPYPLQTASIPVHSANPQSHGSLAQLETGTMIRFNTTKEGWNGREAINEIWITPARPSFKK